MPNKTKRNVCGEMFPSRAIVDDRDRRRELLEVVAGMKTGAPEHAGPFDSSRVPFDLEGAVTLAIDPRMPIYVRRVKSPPWSMVAGDLYPWVQLQSSAPPFMPTAWDLWERLAEVCQPDYSALGLTWRDPVKVTRLPWENPLERTLELCDRVVRHQGHFSLRGVCGLGMRTDFGPRLVAQFGREVLGRLPALVTDTPWGGMRVDVAAEPWKLNPEVYAPLWEACMAPLRETGLLSSPTVDEERGRINFSPNARLVCKWAR